MIAPENKTQEYWFKLMCRDTERDFKRFRKENDELIARIKKRNDPFMEQLKKRILENSGLKPGKP